MSKEAVLVLTAVPADVRQALEKLYALTDLSVLKAANPSPDLRGYRLALTTSMAGIDAALMAAMPDLKFVACNGAGTDKLDLAEAKRRGVAIAHTPDELTEDTADFAIALLYATARRTAEADRFVRSKCWLKERMTPSTRIFGKTLGIVGLGKIGKEIARRAVGLGLGVVYTGRKPQDVPYEFEPDLKRLAERADFLVLSCAGGKETHHLIDGAILAALGPKGMLINISRGSVVEEEALIAGLRDGTIAAAGLDVFASEPAIDERFYDLDNVVLQPHYASITHETRAAMVARISGDIAAFLEGRPFYNAAG